VSSPRLDAWSRHGKHLWRIRKMIKEIIKLICPDCDSDEIVDADYEDNLDAQFRCDNCGKTFDLAESGWVQE
jgi:transposase-like protein